MCQICKKEFENYISLGRHLRIHKITSKEYYDRFLKKEDEGICPVCDKETSFINLNKGYCKFCSYKCARSGENNPNYGKHPSEETKIKISQGNKGKIVSEETKRKMSDVHKGKQHTEETRKKLSDANKGENNPNYGKHWSEETKKKMSDAKKGENNPNYKDGNSLKEFKEAYGIEPEEWKKLAQEVRIRDKFVCQYCGKRNATDVHHIIPRRIKIDNSPDNLITLCKSCHRKIEYLTDKYLSEGKDPREIFYKK
jgi:hypothetical protein